MIILPSLIKKIFTFSLPSFIPGGRYILDLYNLLFFIVTPFVSSENNLSAFLCLNIASNLKTFYKIADYITINISSPNTPNLRKLQQKQNIRELLNLISAEKPINCNLPILLKISPDINQTELSDIIEAAIDSKIDGLIISNTTIDKSMVGKIKNSHQDGGLSGKPLFNLSTRLLAKAYTISEGKIPLIGVGGIANGYDAFLKIKAGASLIQLYTGLVFQGPHVAINIKKELSTLLKEQGFNSIKEIVGIESKNYK